MSEEVDEIFEKKYRRAKKLWLFTGLFGGHRYYIKGFHIEVASAFLMTMLFLLCMLIVPVEIAKKHSAPLP